MFEMFEDLDSEFSQNNGIRKKILLFDGSYALFRAFYGYNLERFQKKDGTPTNGLYGVARTIIQLVNQENPTHLAFAYDKGRDGHRRELLPTYKDGRQKTPEELLAQFPIVKQLLDVASIPHFEQERLEADDIIATLATQGKEQGFEVVIFSSDRDMFQLISDDVKVVRPLIGQAGFEHVTPQVIEKKYGVPPHQYPELQALIGESADNIPGVPGCGPKTALKWIQEFGSLDNLLTNADKVQGKIGDVLREHLDNVRRNRQINQLILDANLEKTLTDLRLKTPNLEQVNQFFREYEMPSLVGKFRW